MATFRRHGETMKTGDLMIYKVCDWNILVIVLKDWGDRVECAYVEHDMLRCFLEKQYLEAVKKCP